MIANDVQQLINDELPVDPDTNMEIETFIYTVPDDVTNDDKITILIADMPSRPVAFGSNTFIEKDMQISLQIYYPADYVEDFDDLGDKVVDILEDHGWFFITNHIASDPETSRSFMMIDLHKVVRRKKKEGN